MGKLDTFVPSVIHVLVINRRSSRHRVIVRLLLIHHLIVVCPVRPLSDSSRYSSSTRPFNRRSSRPSYRSSGVKQIAEEPDTTEEYTLFSLPSGSRTPLYVTVSINKSTLKMKVDTGASFSLISLRTYNELFSCCSLQNTDVRLKTYTRESLHMYGQFTATVQYQHEQFQLLLIVAGDDGPNLLGRDWLYSLKLDWNTIFHLRNHDLTNLLEKHSAVFSQKLGTLKGFKAKLYVNNHQPIFCKARPVPYAIRSQVEAELEKLTQQNIFEPVPFSDWAAPIVPVLKSDKKSIRIFGDFKLTVNRVSKLDRYPNPKIDDLFAKLSGGVLFSKLDLSQAYQQLKTLNNIQSLTLIVVYFVLHVYRLVSHLLRVFSKLRWKAFCMISLV